jgi:hypothetical protein
MWIGGVRVGCASGVVVVWPVWEIYLCGVYYSIAVEPCAVVVCYDIHEQFPV